MTLGEFWTGYISWLHDRKEAAETENDRFFWWAWDVAWRGETPPPPPEAFPILFDAFYERWNRVRLLEALAGGAAEQQPWA